MVKSNVTYNFLHGGAWKSVAKSAKAQTNQKFWNPEGYSEHHTCSSIIKIGYSCLKVACLQGFALVFRPKINFYCDPSSRCDAL